jgi:hypothetical protein
MSATPDIPPHEDTHGTEPEHNRGVFLALAALVGVALIVGAVLYRAEKNTQEARDKADQLVSALDRAGLPVPEDTGQIVDTFGSDGGAVCDDPDSALAKARQDGLFTNGASGPGMRPIRVDADLVRGEVLVLRVYCPDQLPGFLADKDDYELDDVIRP